jgi:hypothetical protein
VHVDDRRTTTGTAAGAGLTMTLDRRYEHARVLHLRGVLTGASAAAVRDAVIAQLALVPAVVVLDLTGVTFVDRGGAERLLDRRVHGAESEQPAGGQVRPRRPGGDEPQVDVRLLGALGHAPQTLCATPIDERDAGQVEDHDGGDQRQLLDDRVPDSGGGLSGEDSAQVQDPSVLVPPVERHGQPGAGRRSGRGVCVVDVHVGASSSRTPRRQVTRRAAGGAGFPAGRGRC